MNFALIKNYIWSWLQNRSSFQKTLLILVVYITIGLLLEEFADLFSDSLGKVQPWDPASGWNVLLLTCMGLRYAPAIFIVNFSENVIDLVIRNQSGSIIGAIVSGIFVTVIYTITAAIFRYSLDFDPDLRRRKDVFQFTIYWTVATFITGFGLFVTLLLIGDVGQSEWLDKALKEWAGEATGVLMLAIPISLALRSFKRHNGLLTLNSEPPKFDWSWLKDKQLLWTWVGFIALTQLCTGLAYGEWIRNNGLEYTYFAFIPLTVVTAWKGFEQGSIIILAINVISVLLFYFRSSQPSSVNGTAIQFGLMTLTYVGVFIGVITTSYHEESNKRKQANDRLYYDANHDSLTKLYNRAWLIERLEQVVLRSKQQPDYSFALLFLDIDRFKSINDSLGHTIGDRLLVEISHRLLCCSPSHKMVVRLGGDEFVVLLEDTVDLDRITLTAQTIIERLSEVYLIETHEIYTSTSIGITYSGFDYQQPEDILRDADIALYQAKARGKSRYALFNKKMYRQIVRRSQLEKDLRRAVQQLI